MQSVALNLYHNKFTYRSNKIVQQVMHLTLNIIFSGVIVILAYKSTAAFRFTSWLLSVMNKGIKD